MILCYQSTPFPLAKKDLIPQFNNLLNTRAKGDSSGWTVESKQATSSRIFSLFYTVKKACSAHGASYKAERHRFKFIMIGRRLI